MNHLASRSFKLTLQTCALTVCLALLLGCSKASQGTAGADAQAPAQVPTTSMVGTGDPGGGDELGLEFLSAFNSALREIERDTNVASNFDLPSLRATAEKVKILTVDHDLKVKLGSSFQESVATNDPKENVIKINRKRWKEIEIRQLRSAVALHEILSLQGLESTGNYTLSARYAGAFGISIERLQATVVKTAFDFSGTWDGECNRFIDGKDANSGGDAALIEIKQTSKSWDFAFSMAQTSGTFRESFSGYMEHSGQSYSIYSFNRTSPDNFSEGGRVKDTSLIYTRDDLAKNELMKLEILEVNKAYSPGKKDGFHFYLDKYTLKDGRMSNEHYYCYFAR